MGVAEEEDELDEDSGLVLELDDEVVGDAVICPRTLVRVIVADGTLPVVDSATGNVVVVPPRSTSALNTENIPLRFDSSPSTRGEGRGLNACMLRTRMRADGEWTVLTRDDVAGTRVKVQGTADVDCSVGEHYARGQGLVFAW